jgi:hypothetical protein
MRNRFLTLTIVLLAGLGLAAKDFDVFGQTTAVATVTNTTVVSSPDALAPLTFSVGANEKWRVSVNLVYDSATNADVKIGLTAPAGATFNLIAICPKTDAVSTAENQINAIFQDGPLVCGGLGQYQWMTAQGTVVSSKTGGPVQVAFAQGTAQSSNTSLGQTSTLTATRIQ